MVVKMMRWRPWPNLLTKKFEVKLVLHRVEGFQIVSGEIPARLMVEIMWKGSRFSFGSLRIQKRNFTKEEELRSDGVIEWNEEFQSLCNLSARKEDEFYPWKITFTVFSVSNQRSKNKLTVVGTGLLDLAKYASVANREELEINIPLTVPDSSAEPHPSLCLSLNLLELRTTQEPSKTVQISVTPVSMSPRSREALSPEKDELSVLKAGLRKVKILKEYVSTQKAKKACREEDDSEGRSSVRTEDGESIYPFDTESPDDLDDEELEDIKEDLSIRNSFSYGTLAHANCVGELCYSEMRKNEEFENSVYYSNRKEEVGCVQLKDTTASSSDQSFLQSSKRSILSWRKRKLSFRSPKAKGEPLLKKAYGEEGGDDIDYDRRQLNSSDDSFALWWHKGDEGSTTNRSSISEFGDDNFAIGNWEHKEVVSRDGQMKLLTQVFFASIDQRSERAAGESACTALVAVIADWLQINQDVMPIKSQFDSLIRDGSLEWRNLCKNETNRDRFPDKHFDLDTVLQARIRSLTVTSQKSFIGFFHPDGMDEGSGFDFLHGAMSFDNIWDEISGTGSESSAPQVYIVSWNDHFFVLKVESEAYYIIDTLGERLFEGCNQAYILKFDRDTIIKRMPNEEKSSEEKPKTGDQQIVPELSESNKPNEEEVVCEGKESCKEYIKRFLAAIPIRELQVDIKKGLMDSTPLHHRLQIEFHYTELLQPEPLAAEAAVAATTEAAVAATTEAIVAAA